MKKVLFCVLLLTGCATEPQPPMTDLQRMMLLQVGQNMLNQPAYSAPAPVVRQTSCYKVGFQVQCMTY